VIRLPGKHVARIGHIERLSPDTVVLRDAGGTRWSVALGTAHRLELSDGRKRHLLMGALIGGAAGALGGTLIGMESDHDADRDYQAHCGASLLGCDSGGRWFDGFEIGVGAVIGGASGVVVGTLIGAIPRERWRAAALPLQAVLRTTRDGRGLVASVPLGRQQR
jgi:hypothetical protein